MSHWRHTQTALTLDDVIARSTVTSTDCWLWTGSFSAQGYAVYGKNGHVRVGRLMWEHKHKREMPDAFMACHTCDNPACVNPDHIYEGTTSQNSKDAWARTRKAHPRVVQTLTNTEVGEIKRLLGSESNRALARRYGVSHATINKIANGLRFTDIKASL